MFLCHWVMRERSMKEVAAKTSPWILGLAWGVMLFLIFLSQGSGEQSIYFQF
jgi:alginate O-acetyltransferase complex protein AlgI